MTGQYDYAIGSPICESCHVPFAEHDGLQLLCDKLQLAKKRLQTALALLREIAERDNEPCRYDHNRFCQAHCCGEPCLIGRVKEMAG